MAAWVERRDEPEDGTRGSCSRGAEPEAKRRNHLRVDAKQLGRHRVLYRCPNGPPELGALQNQVQKAEHHQGQQEGEEPNHVHLVPQHRPTKILIAGLNRPKRRVVDHGQQSLEAERDGEGDEQRELRRILRP